MQFPQILLSLPTQTDFRQLFARQEDFRVIEQILKRANFTEADLILTNSRRQLFRFTNRAETTIKKVFLPDEHADEPVVCISNRA